MKKLGFLLAGLMTAGVLTLAGCGGGGGGNGGAPTAAGTTFNMVELAGFGGSEFSAGVAINDDGLAVGFSNNGTNINGAKWLVTDTSPAATLLEPLAGNNYSAAYGVNAAGVAVGESGATVATVADANTVAVFWPAGSSIPTALSTNGLFAGGASAAFSINTDGEIVGEAVDDVDGNTVAIYWASDSVAPVKLNKLSGSGKISSAYSIGSDGRIVGEAEDNNGTTQAVVWLPVLPAGYGDPTVLTAVANQRSSVALGVDGIGRIVGEAELNSGVVRGVIWNANGSVATTFAENTSVQAINNANRIVGYSAALSGGDIASIWSVANILDTKNLAVGFSQAYGINADNQVVGISGTRAFAALPQ